MSDNGHAPRSSVEEADPMSMSLQLRPLTARSVILSVLLGNHPPLLAVKTLVSSLEVFGINEGTTRVALSRLAADGDVVADGGYYRLSNRLVDRQKIQDETLRPATRAWRGGWELAIAGPSVKSAADRASLGSELERLRLAELRPGVWVRPDNLVRDWPPEISEQAWRFESRSGFDKAEAAELVRSLWNVTGWATAAETLIQMLAAAKAPSERFELAAAMVRHLRHDPMLPPSLLPERWPGPRLRGTYDSYRRELRKLIIAEQEKTSS